jgi:hypothetical protein
MAPKAYTKKTENSTDFNHHENTINLAYFLIFIIFVALLFLIYTTLNQTG